MNFFEAISKRNFMLPNFEAFFAKLCPNYLQIGCFDIHFLVGLRGLVVAFESHIREVPGSNPGGDIFLFISHCELRRENKGFMILAGAPARK